MQDCSVHTSLRFLWLHGEVLDGEKMTLSPCHGPVKPIHRPQLRSMSRELCQAHDDDDDDDYPECQRSPCGVHDMDL